MTGPACGSLCVSKSTHETGHDQSEITGHEIFEMTGHGPETPGHDGLKYAMKRFKQPFLGFVRLGTRPSDMPPHPAKRSTVRMVVFFTSTFEG